MKDAETGPRQTGPHTSVPDWPVDHGASCPHANLTTCSTCNILHIIHTPYTHTSNQPKRFLPSHQPSQTWKHAPHTKASTKHCNCLFFVLDIMGQERHIYYKEAFVLALPLDCFGNSFRLFWDCFWVVLALPLDCDFFNVQRYGSGTRSRAANPK